MNLSTTDPLDTLITNRFGPLRSNTMICIRSTNWCQFLKELSIMCLAYIHAFSLIGHHYIWYQELNYWFFSSIHRNTVPIEFIRIPLHNLIDIIVARDYVQHLRSFWNLIQIVSHVYLTSISCIRFAYTITIIFTYIRTCFHNVFYRKSPSRGVRQRLHMNIKHITTNTQINKCHKIVIFSISALIWKRCDD